MRRVAAKILTARIMFYSPQPLTGSWMLPPPQSLTGSWIWKRPSARPSCTWQQKRELLQVAIAREDRQNGRQRSCGTVHSEEDGMDTWGNFSPLSKHRGRASSATSFHLSVEGRLVAGLCFGVVGKGCSST